MTPWILCGLALGAALAAAPAALAQAAAQPAGQPSADPADPAAQVPPPRHRSAFAGYRRTTAVTPLAWPQANEQVHRIGGWRAYLREAQTPAPAASAPAAGERKP